MVTTYVRVGIPTYIVRICVIDESLIEASVREECQQNRARRLGQRRRRAALELSSRAARNVQLRAGR